MRASITLDLFRRQETSPILLVMAVAIVSTKSPICAGMTSGLVAAAAGLWSADAARHRPEGCAP